MQGSHRFLRRVWKQVYDHLSGGSFVTPDVNALNDIQKDMRRQVHETIKKCSDDIGRRFTFNTAIAAVMELMNALAKFEDNSDQGRAVMQEALEAITLMLSPMVPHISHALWHALGKQTTIIDEAWPTVDESALKRDSVEVVVQVNGKLRARISVAADADKATIEQTALADENVQRFTEGKQVFKVIVVPGKLVNIVVK